MPVAHARNATVNISMASLSKQFGPTEHPWPLPELTSILSLKPSKNFSNNETFHCEEFCNYMLCSSSLNQNPECS